MRSLKYTVVALTPLLGAGGFAQGLNLGMNDGVMLQARAPAQTPVNGEVRPDVGSPMAVDLKGSPRTHAKTQAHKAGKKSKDRVAN